MLTVTVAVIRQAVTPGGNVVGHALTFEPGNVVLSKVSKNWTLLQAVAFCGAAGVHTGVPDGGAGAAGRAESDPVLHWHSSYQARCATRSESFDNPELKSALNVRWRIAADSAAVKTGMAGGSLPQKVESVSSGRDKNGMTHFSHPAPYLSRTSAANPAATRVTADAAGLAPLVPPPHSAVTSASHGRNGRGRSCNAFRYARLMRLCYLGRLHSVDCLVCSVDSSCAPHQQYRIAKRQKRNNHTAVDMQWGDVHY